MSEDPNKIFTPGMSIENKSATADDYAAIGCFARTTSDGATVLLSCAHTMFADLSDETNLKIWSPPSIFTCCRHRHIADTLTAGSMGSVTKSAWWRSASRKKCTMAMRPIAR
jgi:hypothetical protein